MEKRKSTLFMSSVLTILVAQLVVKITGLLYRLVITNIDGFGDLGNGFYNAGFQIYTMLLVLSSVGIPGAISKLVSAEVAVGNRRRAYQIFRTALLLFFLIGLTCSAAMYLGAGILARYIIRMDGTQGTLRALSPAVLFVCLSSVVRGYFMGLGNVNATSRSQMLEQLVKSVLTILFVLALTGYSAEVMSAGANFATSVAAASSAVYLTIFYFRSKERHMLPPKDCTAKGWGSFISLSRTILAVSAPISLASIITSAGRVIDTGTISRGIAAAFAAGIPGQSGIPSAAELNDEAVRLAGMLSKSDSLLNLPLALNIAFATVLVPTVSAAMASGRQEEAREKVEFSLLISVLFILPCSAGLIVLAEPIYRLIYPNAPQGWELLQIASVGMVFTALNQTLNGSLQGMGKASVPAKALLFGVAAKVTLNLILIRIPAVNIFGAPVASTVCYLIASLICFSELTHALVLHMPMGKYLLKPLACTAVMGAGAAVEYRLFQRMVMSNGLAVLLTVLCSVILYLFLILCSRVLSETDIALLPVGERIKQKLLACARRNVC